MGGAWCASSEEETLMLAINNSGERVSNVRLVYMYLHMLPALYYHCFSPDCDSAASFHCADVQRTP